MPKRNTIETTLETLNAGDLDAMSRKAAALQAIPHPVYNGSIPFGMVYSDKEFNVRDDASYAADDNAELFKSLKEKGLEHRGDMMAFHLESDGRFKVLVGHLRSAMMANVRGEEIKRRADENLPADPDTLPFATIFGLVYSGLSAGQQTAIMADHIGRKDLNEFEKCKEIGEMIEQNGLTDLQASTHFGIDKNKVSRYRMRWAMPTVMAEFRKEKAGKGSTVPYISVGQKQLTALYAAYLKDKEAGCKHRQEGPNFRAAWEMVKADATAFKTPAPKGPESKERDTIVSQMSGLAVYGDGPELDLVKNVMEWTAGSDVRLDVALQGLVSLCNGYREKIDELTATVATLKEENAALTVAGRKGR